MDMVRLNVEQADGTKLISSGIGKLAGAPAYVYFELAIRVGRAYNAQGSLHSI